MIRIIEEISTYNSNKRVFYLERKSFWGWELVINITISNQKLLTFDTYNDAEEYILKEFSNGIILKNGNTYKYSEAIYGGI